ncbi:unnamed protein product, partial [Cuscuta europaea]
MSSLDPNCPSSVDVSGMSREFQLAKTIAIGLHAGEVIDVNVDADIVGMQYGFQICQEEIVRFLKMESLDICAVTLFCICLYQQLDLKANKMFGLLCPNMVQQKTDDNDKIAYLSSTFLRGTKKYYLAPYYESCHWTLCVICPSSYEAFWFDSIDSQPSQDIKQIIEVSFKQAALKGRTSANRYSTTKWVICP